MEKKELVGKKILIVDDEEMIREILVEEFEAHGARAVQAASGHEGLKCLSDHPDVDVVISDAKMLGMGGIELIRTFQKAEAQRAQRMKFFICSGMPQFSDEELEGVKLTGVLPKPFDMDVVLASVSSAL